MSRIRIGIDVGGTFTKAVALDVGSGDVLSKSTVPTTHDSERGVSDGIVQALNAILDDSGIRPGDIELVAHSTTQAINALLESDTHKVGIVAMGVGPTKSDVVKRTRLDSETRGYLRTGHEFLDTSHLITPEEVRGAVERMRDDGAEVIVATEAFGVDDPSNELFVMKGAAQLGLPSTSSHEISGTYGLEIRTLTAAINASVLPKTFQVADFVEDAIRTAGVDSPLMIMKGDGGVTSMDTFRTKPILTILSGPAASVAGALLHLRVTNGIFVEVGGTSTNICIIRNGRPEIRYATIRDHPTCIRSMDVRILGVAGGSMVAIERRRVSHVGPRSAHVAGLKYACFADPDELESGEITMIKPKSTDTMRYAAVRCGGNTYAITNTCAANALGMIERDDYSYAGGRSAQVAMQKLGGHMGVSYTEAAMSIIQTSSFEITKAVSRALKEYKLDAASTRIIGGGGGASVLAPFVAKQMGMGYEKSRHAEVISSIGVASSMMQEEMEISMVRPSPEEISRAHKKIHSILASKGAVPESIVIDSTYIPDRSILRVSAVGNVELDSSETSRTVFTPDEQLRRAAEIIGVGSDLAEVTFESDHYAVITGHVSEKRLFGRKNTEHTVVLDRFGRPKLSVRNARVLLGDSASMLGDLEVLLGSGGVAPQVYVVDDLKTMDFSGLTSASSILAAVRAELDGGRRAAVIVSL